MIILETSFENRIVNFANLVKVVKVVECEATLDFLEGFF